MPCAPGAVCIQILALPAVRVIDAAVKNQLKNVRDAIKSGGKDSARAAAAKFFSTVDKAVKAGRLHNGESLSVYVTPGPHRLHSQGNAVNVDVDAKAGETYHVRYDVAVGFLKERANIALVNPQDAANETAQITHQNEGGN